MRKVHFKKGALDFITLVCRLVVVEYIRKFYAQLLQLKPEIQMPMFPDTS